MGFSLCSMIGIGIVRASVTTDWDDAALVLLLAGAFCVTVPTIAWPPSLTETFCTVTFFRRLTGTGTRLPSAS